MVYVAIITDLKNLNLVSFLFYSIQRKTYQQSFNKVKS